MLQRQQPESGDKNRSFQYRLYGVVVHDGRSLEGGHYTACVRMRSVDVSRARTFLQKTFLDRQLMTDREQLIKLVASDDLRRQRLSEPVNYQHDGNDDEGRWFDISDSSVREIRHKQELFAKQAYLLFYERVA